MESEHLSGVVSAGRSRSVRIDHRRQLGDRLIPLHVRVVHHAGTDILKRTAVLDEDHEPVIPGTSSAKPGGILANSSSARMDLTLPSIATGIRAARNEQAALEARAFIAWPSSGE